MCDHLAGPAMAPWGFEIKKLISLGLGVNSTAMTLLLYSLGYHFPIVFADTKGEWPETYEFFNEFDDFLYHKWDAKIQVLAPPYEYAPFESLEAFYLHYRMIPYRKYRICTDRFKIRPITKKFPDYIHLIGIDISEKHRIQKKTAYAEIKEYPLIKMGLNREDCKRTIKQFGLRIPPKSGCFFCPFQRKAEFQKLQKKHPELWQRVLKLEKNSGKYLKDVGKPIEEWIYTKQMDLFDWY